MVTEAAIALTAYYAGVAIAVALIITIAVTRRPK